MEYLPKKYSDPLVIYSGDEKQDYSNNMAVGSLREIGQTSQVLSALSTQSLVARDWLKHRPEQTFLSATQKISVGGLLFRRTIEVSLTIRSS